VDRPRSILPQNSGTAIVSGKADSDIVLALFTTSYATAMIVTVVVTPGAHRDPHGLVLRWGGMPMEDNRQLLAGKDEAPAGGGRAILAGDDRQCAGVVRLRSVRLHRPRHQHPVLPCP